MTIGILNRCICSREAARIKLLLGCLLLCILTALSACAQDTNLVCQSVDMAGYASVNFCLPSDVFVTQKDLAEVNYTEGREVKSLLLLNGNEVYLHLIYPCAIKAGLSESEVKSPIEAFDPEIKMADYRTEPISISGRPAVWGQSGNWTFTAYQPADMALAVIYFPESLNQDIMSRFLEGLDISVNETVSPLWPGYCVQERLQRTENESLPVLVKIEEGNYSNENQPKFQESPEAEKRLVRFEATRERMMSDMEETKKRLEKTEENLGGFGMIPNPIFQS